VQCMEPHAYSVKCLFTGSSGENTQATEALSPPLLGRLELGSFLAMKGHCSENRGANFSLLRLLALCESLVCVASRMLVSCVQYLFCKFEIL
jgi:hypothetical protein